ncbi:MAG: methyl-accepting chemotaxis protein [Oscillospiraceae bacterium]|nr:methyl-accepting chemotaxis protein [Oscillospiraceae bacterium]
MKKLNLGEFKFEFKSLKMKLIAFVCAMLLVIIAVLSIVSMSSMSSGITDTVNLMVDPLNKEVASDVSSKIDMLKAQSETVLLRTLSSNQIGVDQSTGAYLKQQIRDTGLGAKEFVLFKAGSYYTSSENIKKEDCDAIKQLDIYVKARTTKKVEVCDPHVTEDGTNAEFVVVVPGMLGVTSYTLVMYFDVDVLSQICNSVQFGETGRTYLINSEGRVIAGTLEEVVTEYNPSILAETDRSYKKIAEVHELAIAQETGTTTGNVNGIASQIAYAPIANSEWAVILVAPESEFTGSVVTSSIVILVISVIMLVASVICTFIIMNGIVNPISKVTSRLKLLSDGDLESPVDVIRQKNEIGILSASLNTTVDSLRMYIEDISRSLEKISDGDFAFAVDANYMGDFVKIKDSFNNILAQLRKTFEKINSAAVQVSDGASQVASGAQHLSVGAVQQSEAINRVSMQIDDIVKNVAVNADAAEGTGKLVDRIEEQIDSCNKEMNKMLASMSDITKSSSQISEIIKVIDDIAFQTNILALNAAVEAARAGDAGRGFAVVADEVRNLANMSADAAKQTGELIEDSLRTVKHGTVIAKTTAESLNEIVASASEINEKVKDIADASKEQNDIVEAIRDSVQQVTGVIDNTSSTAEQSAAAAQEMSGQAEMLREMIAQFKYEIDFDETAYVNEDEVDDDMFSEIISENDDVFDFLNADAEETEAVAEETEDEIVDEVITDPVAIADELAAEDDAEEFVPIEFESFTDEEFQHHSDDKY